jgi:hypothetical protein
MTCRRGLALGAPQADPIWAQADTDHNRHNAEGDQIGGSSASAGNSNNRSGKNPSHRRSKRVASDKTFHLPETT